MAKPKAPTVIAAVLLGALMFCSSARAAPEAAPDPAATLSKIVGRLSGQDACSALDWAELGGETVTWGQHLKSASLEVPEGPVRDALRAVESGRRADPKASDWGQMKSQLEELLTKPEEKKQDQKKDQDQKQDQDKQDQKPGDDKQQDQKPKDQQSKQDQDRKDQQKDSQGQPQKNSQDQKQQQNKESAFGNMNRPTPTPTPGCYKGATQKVGGVRKDEPNDPARANPELAVPLQKLEQVKSQDSPAELFELLRNGEPIPTPANAGKNW